jgi:Mg-chelatase subunit ChlD
MPYDGGNTNTTGGLRVMRTDIFNTYNGDRPDVTNVCILVTDGVPTREVAGLTTEVQNVRNAGIRVIGVGITNAVSEVGVSFVSLFKL